MRREKQSTVNKEFVDRKADWKGGLSEFHFVCRVKQRVR